MGDHAEAGRLWATALGAAVLGAVVGGLLMRGEAASSPLSVPAIELAPIEAALRDLRSAVQPAVSVSAPEPPRQPLREPVARGSPSRADLDASVQRVMAALHALAERLEKIAAEDHRSAQLTAMVQEMGELPRGVPPNWAALQQHEEQVLELSDEIASKTQTCRRRRVFDQASRQLDRQKDALLDEIGTRLEQTARLEPLFTVRWRLS